jgi:hypothetical protein
MIRDVFKGWNLFLKVIFFWVPYAIYRQELKAAAMYLPSIENLRSIVLNGRHAPDHEETLHQPVEGNPSNKDI